MASLPMYFSCLKTIACASFTSVCFTSAFSTQTNWLPISVDKMFFCLGHGLLTCFCLMGWWCGVVLCLCCLVVVFASSWLFSCWYVLYVEAVSKPVYFTYLLVLCCLCGRLVKLHVLLTCFIDHVLCCRCWSVYCMYVAYAVGCWSVLLTVGWLHVAYAVGWWNCMA